MIDFRFHLISIVAVFLALGVGILMGSLVLGDNLVRHLESRVREVRERNDQLLEEVGSLRSTVEGLEAFGLELEPALVHNALLGERFVVVEIQTPGRELAPEIALALEGAGAEAAATISMTDRLGLTGQPEIDQLALILRSTSEDPHELRTEAGAELGRLVGAAADARTEGESLLAQNRLARFVDAMNEAGFLTGSAAPGELDIPAGALFVVVGGGPDEIDFDPRSMAVELSVGLADGGAAALVAEPSDSRWGLVRSVRGDDRANALVATVDNVEVPPGRIAVSLALRQALDGEVGHYGTGAGSDRIVPLATPLD